LETRSRILMLAIAMVFVASARRCHADPINFTSFNCHCVALGINDSGEVVGVTGQTSGNPNFLWNGSSFQTITTPAGWSYVSANSINNAGQIVGSYYGNGTLNGFLDSGGVFTSINFPGSSSSDALHIDNSGATTGVFDGSGIFTLSNGVYSQVSATSPFELDAEGANDLGWIVGTTGGHGFVLVDGNVTYVDFPGATQTVATGVDDFGDIVGYYDDAGGRHGFLYSGNTFTSIDYAGASETDIYGVNNEGQLVGTAWVGTFPSYTATGFVADFTPGELPTPEPSTFGLAISGVAFLLGLRRRVSK
jgi:hypothetical protein